MLAFVLDDILHIKLFYLGYTINYFLFLKFGILAEILFFAMALGKRTYILEQERTIHLQNYIQQLETKNALEKKINYLKSEILNAQINPHFIFNSLNSLQYFINIQDLNNANIYLKKLSKLIRQILDCLRKESITLTEELDIAHLYIKIENMRLNNSIQYIFNNSLSVTDMELVKIPSLLLQPFIENAIWHGLQNSNNSKKILEISVKKTDAIIELTIYDNGIGIENNQKLHTFKKSKSHGIDITKERILINNQSHHYIEFSIINQPAIKDNIGTLVQFKFHTHAH